jgi:tripeptide aminopeptidase
METLLDRFLSYVRIDTQANEASNSHPSTARQKELAGLLAKELEELGLSNITINDKAYLMAEVPANIDKDLPVVGFIAHLDTSPDVSGKDVQPQIFENYDGQDLILNQAQNLILRVDQYPELGSHIGQTIITSDGTTLLGADNKAGVAIIMTAAATLISNPDLKHGKIVIAFTPDEEIGQGADYFDVHAFGADFAYTIDGGGLGELEYENFNAATAHIDIQGINVHPGSACGRMKNAILLAMELNGMLPALERPEHTRDYEGFYHLNSLEGSVESARMAYIIRDHDRAKFEQKKAFLEDCSAQLNSKYGEATVNLQITDQYYNMREKIEPVYHIVSLAQKALLENGINPIIKPVRGGTDGARLSFMGLPCPNLFTGGHNFHSRYEFISLESMEAAVKVIHSIVRLIEGGWRQNGRA